MRWGLTLLVLLLVLCAGLGFALWSVNGYLNDNRAWVEQQAESALGRPLSLGKMGLTLWGGLGATISDLEIADDPAFSEEPFVEASAVRVNVALWPALFGRIEVREIVLERPVVRVIRARSGMNFETLGAATSSRSDTTAGSEEDEGAAVGDAGRALAVVVALVRIEDGRISYTDRTVTPASTQMVRLLDLGLTGVGTAEPARIEFAAAVLGSSDQNVRLAGAVGPVGLASARDFGGLSVDLSLRGGPLAVADLPAPLEIRGKARGDLDDLRVDLRLSLATLEAGASGTVNVGPPLVAELKIDAQSPDLALVSLGIADTDVRDPEKLRDLKAEGRLTIADGAPQFDGELRMAGSVRDIPFERFVAHVELKDDVARLSRVEIGVFGGTYEGAARYDFRNPRNPRFEARQKLSDLEITEILASRVPDSAGRMTGRLSGRLQVAGGGANSDEVRASLKGDGEVSVQDGVLRGVNLPEEILRSLTGVGGLTSLLPDDLRVKYGDVLSAEDTPFEELSASVVIGNRAVTTDDALIAARDYRLRSEGSLDFDGEMDFATTFVASEKLTGDVIQSVREVRHITNSDGRLEIPVQISGVLPDVSVEPDRAFLARSVTRGAIGKGLEFLGIGTEEPGQDESSGEDGSAPSRKKKPSGSDLIQKGLDSLFGN